MEEVEAALPPLLKFLHPILGAVFWGTFSGDFYLEIDVSLLGWTWNPGSRREAICLVQKQGTWMEQHFIFTEGRCYCRTLVGVEILHCDKDDTIL